MTYDDAIECDEITLAEAIAECLKHGVQAWLNGTTLTALNHYDPTDTTDDIAEMDERGYFNGADVLGWLGY